MSTAPLMIYFNSVWYLGKYCELIRLRSLRFYKKFLSMWYIDCNFPFSIANDCFTKRSMDESCCNCKCILVFKVNFCNLCIKTKCLRCALCSSEDVKRGTTDRFNQKSLDKKWVCYRKAIHFLSNILLYDEGFLILFCGLNFETLCFSYG